MCPVNNVRSKIGFLFCLLLHIEILIHTELLSCKNVCVLASPSVETLFTARLSRLQLEFNFLPSFFQCEAEHDPHHKRGSGKKTKKSGLGSMFEKRSTPKMSKLKVRYSLSVRPPGYGEKDFNQAYFDLCSCRKITVLNLE